MTMTNSATHNTEETTSPQGASDERLGDLLDLFDACDAKETIKERDREHRNQLQGLLIDLLRVADALSDLERHCSALEAEGVSHAPTKSVELVRRMLLRALKAQQVEPMECNGRRLDLDQHEVVEVKHVPGTADDIVLHENLQGYTWQDRVLRPAKVVVSRAEAAADVAGASDAPNTHSAQSSQTAGV
jgi:molecular chaperone GrpE (heat shock protein)